MNEHTKTMEALRIAIQMEVDGKEYYENAVRMSSNEEEKELFRWLAAEEDRHQEQFRRIYEAIRESNSWPEANIEISGRKKIAPLFVRATNKTDVKAKPFPDELDAVVEAMDMEEKTRSAYQERLEKASSDAERSFYDSLIAEERGHYLALVDYMEYLTDPMSWLEKKERHSLDGG